MVIVAVSCTMTVGVLNIHFSAHSHRLPRPLRLMLHGPVGRLFCMASLTEAVVSFTEAVVNLTESVMSLTEAVVSDALGSDKTEVSMIMVSTPTFHIHTT